MHYKTEGSRVTLPSALVLQTHQDRQGYLWVVINSSGLARYDGVGFDLYTTADGLPDLYVYTMVEDEQGFLWVGCVGGLVVSAKPVQAFEPNERIRFVATIDGLPLTRHAVRARCLATDPFGGIWVAVPELGLIHHSLLSGQLLSSTVPLPASVIKAGKEIRCLLVQRDGTVWAGVPGGLLRVLPGRFSADFLAFEPDGESVAALYEDRHEQMWLGGEKGSVWRWQTELPSPAAEEIHLGVVGEITSFLEGLDGVMWITSYGDGLIKFQEEKSPRVRTFDRENGFLTGLISHISHDDEHNLWVSQNLGLSKLRANYDAHIHLTATGEGKRSALLPESGVQSVVPLDASSSMPYLFAATEGGGLAIFNDRFESMDLSVTDGLQNNVANAVARDGQNRIWIGSNLGIDRLSWLAEATMPGQASKPVSLFGKPAFLQGFATSVIHYIRVLTLPTAGGRQEEVVVFLSQNGLFLFARDDWYFLGEDGGLPDGELLAAVVDAQGRLWIGSQNHGLFRSRVPLREFFDQPRLSRRQNKPAFIFELHQPLMERVWSRENGAPTNHIRSMAFHRGKLWVGTGSGLAVLNHEDLLMSAFFTKREGLGADNITSMAVSPADDTIWVGTNKGISQIEPESLKVLRTVDRTEGLLDDEVWYLGSVAVDQQGMVYFGNPKGLSLYRPALDNRPRRPPRLHFEKLTWVQNLWGRNEFAADYRGLSFFNEEDVRYQTRLLGLHPEWSPPSNVTAAKYSNLHPFFTSKRYTFEVIAGIEDGPWVAQPLTHNFEVHPPLWLRWWFLLLAAFALFALALVIHRGRTQRLKWRAKNLESVVQQRTAELQINNQKLSQALGELTEMNHQIVDRQKQLILSEKMASVGILTKGIAHELRNPMNFICNLSDINVEILEEIDHVITRKHLTSQETNSIRERLGDVQKNTQVVARHGHAAEMIVGRMQDLATSGPDLRSDVDFNRFVKEYVGIAMSAFREENNLDIQWRVSFSPDQPRLYVFPRKMSRALINIIRNALEAVSEKAQQAKEPFQPCLSLTTLLDPAGVSVVVADNGPGIHKDIRDRIFTPFFTTRPAGSGHVGLGLSMAYEIVVEDHGGALILHESAQGATFEIRLPTTEP